MSVVTAASSTPEAPTRARLGMLMTPTAAGGETQRDHDGRYDDSTSARQAGNPKPTPATRPGVARREV
jgi:hypothetical protein